METDDGAGGAQRLTGLHRKELGRAVRRAWGAEGFGECWRRGSNSSRAQLEVGEDGGSQVNQWRVYPWWQPGSDLGCHGVDGYEAIQAGVSLLPM